ncbi:LOW QUALITY PROTEIN: protein delta homolog 1 [Esox lucius]|uniref:LOW QUALITY PROTEIN: protein delta homolog 1 n=1 Tax=Esox lucius TaxID=8010 RepID=UPI001476CC31|nr:LOW QUALITY PROTEIN: protein delta homolog 1 [Esox lucius]
MIHASTFQLCQPVLTSRRTGRAEQIKAVLQACIYFGHCKEKLVLLDSYWFCRRRRMLNIRMSPTTFVFVLVVNVGVTKALECSAGCNPENGYCEKPGECRCRPGWRGVACGQCVLYPGCLHGTCEKAWQCICEEGWTGSLCDQDANRCSSQPCAENSTCIQTDQGGFLCFCPPGYTGDSCQLRKGPCQANGSPCQNGGTCDDASGLAAYPSCACPLGYAGDFCEIDTDSCDPDPCANGGQCRDHGPTFTCACPAGFTGLTCNSTDGETLSPCSGSPCGHGGTCVAGNRTDAIGPYRCLCPPAFTFTGRGCTPNQQLRRPSAKLKPAKLSDRRPSPQHYGLPPRSFHKLLRAAEGDLPKVTLKEAIHAPPADSLVTRSQIICFGMLGLLTCLVILGTTGIIFFNRCEAWLANAKYSQLVRLQREHLLGPAARGGGHSVNVILPEKIKLTSFGKRYTSI